MMIAIFTMNIENDDQKSGALKQFWFCKVSVGSDPYFPRARAPQYSMERWRAYLLSSEWVQEYPHRYGRHTLP